MTSVDRVPVPVFIRPLSGRTITIKVSLADPVSDAMPEILARAGVPADLQRLIFAGRSLEAARPLASYGVQRDSTLHLVARLLGGSSGDEGGYDDDDRDSNDSGGGFWAAHQHLVADDFYVDDADQRPAFEIAWGSSVYPGGIDSDDDGLGGAPPTSG